MTNHFISNFSLTGSPHVIGMSTGLTRWPSTWDWRTCEAAVFQYGEENKGKKKKRVELLAWLNEQQCPCKRQYH
jgi:hypothetical protein